MNKLFFAFLLMCSQLCSAEAVDRILAIVNDDLVSSSDVKGFQARLKKNGLVDDALLNVYDRAKLMSDSTAALNYLIDERTIDSEIRSAGIAAPIEQVESEIRDIARARGIDKNQLRAALKAEGLAYSDYQDFVKTSLQRQTLLQREVSSKIKISDEEVNAFYVSKHSQSKALVFEYSLSHIVLLYKNGGLEAAKSRAQAAAAKISTGLSFDAAAAQFSEDPLFVQGGFFGTFRASDFNEDIASVISKLNQNEVSPPVSMPDGVHIFKVVKKTLVASPDLEKRREEIRRALTSEAFKKHLRAWLEKKRKSAYIKINQ